MDAAELRHHYFVLLWCFERIWHGYQVVSRDRVLGLGAGKEFASMLGWHVRNWSEDLPAIKQALETEVGEIHDGHAVRALAALGDAVFTEADIRMIRSRLGQRSLQPVGNPAWGLGRADCAVLYLPWAAAARLYLGRRWSGWDPSLRSPRPGRPSRTAPTTRPASFHRPPEVCLWPWSRSLRARLTPSGLFAVGAP